MMHVARLICTDEHDLPRCKDTFYNGKRSNTGLLYLDDEDGSLIDMRKEHYPQMPQILPHHSIVVQSGTLKPSCFGPNSNRHGHYEDQY